MGEDDSWADAPNRAGNCLPTREAKNIVVERIDSNKRMA
jgi:hypothetical protein